MLTGDGRELLRERRGAWACRADGRPGPSLIHFSARAQRRDPRQRQNRSRLTDAFPGLRTPGRQLQPRRRHAAAIAANSNTSA